MTADGKLSAQYEHTIAVTSNGCEILTPWHLPMRENAGLPAPRCNIYRRPIHSECVEGEFLELRLSEFSEVHIAASCYLEH